MKAPESIPKEILMVYRVTCAAVLALVLLAPAGGAAATINLRASDVHPAGFPTVVAIEKMGRRLQEETGGRIKLQMFPGGVLGSDKSVVEQVQVGAVQIARISLGEIGAIVPDVNVFNMPFVFRDEAHMRKIIDGAIGDEMLDKVSNSSAKLIALGWMDSGSRSVYAKKAIKTPADLQGIKIRSIGNSLFLNTMNAMGGQGIPMSFGDVYHALQTGAIDAAENNSPSLYTSGHYSFTRYYSQTRHLIIPEIFVMSKATWNKLSRQDRALVKKLSRQAQAEQRVLWDETVADSNAGLKAAGVVFSEVDRQAFYEATAGIRSKYGAPYKDLIARIEAVR
jgi:tripartite ATP-independent transporter DctP family solute receptor